MDYLSPGLREIARVVARWRGRWKLRGAQSEVARLETELGLLGWQQAEFDTGTQREVDKILHTEREQARLRYQAQANELEDKATLLAEQNQKVELKNREVELKNRDSKGSREARGFCVRGVSNELEPAPNPVPGRDSVELRIANPRLVWRLEKIHVRALGIST